MEREQARRFIVSSELSSEFELEALIMTITVTVALRVFVFWLP
jgi:hypothetical protein